MQEIKEILKDNTEKNITFSEPAESKFKDCFKEDFEKIEEGHPMDSRAFTDYWEENSEQFEGKTKEEAYEECDDKYEYFNEWLERDPEDWHISLADYNDMRCVEDYG